MLMRGGAGERELCGPWRLLPKARGRGDPHEPGSSSSPRTQEHSPWPGSSPQWWQPRRSHPQLKWPQHRWRSTVHRNSTTAGGESVEARVRRGAETARRKKRGKDGDLLKMNANSTLPSTEDRARTRYMGGRSHGGLGQYEGLMPDLTSPREKSFVVIRQSALMEHTTDILVTPAQHNRRNTNTALGAGECKRHRQARERTATCRGVTKVPLNTSAPRHLPPPPSTHTPHTLPHTPTPKSKHPQAQPHTHPPVVKAAPVLPIGFAGVPLGPPCGRLGDEVTASVPAPPQGSRGPGGWGNIHLRDTGRVGWKREGEQGTRNEEGGGREFTHTCTCT
jgi:hypothetical protein